MKHDGKFSLFQYMQNKVGSGKYKIGRLQDFRKANDKIRQNRRILPKYMRYLNKQQNHLRMLRNHYNKRQWNNFVCPVKPLNIFVYARVCHRKHHDTCYNMASSARYDERWCHRITAMALKYRRSRYTIVSPTLYAGTGKAVYFSGSWLITLRACLRTGHTNSLKPHCAQVMYQAPSVGANTMGDVLPSSILQASATTYDDHYCQREASTLAANFREKRDRSDLKAKRVSG